ncbi:hypothetical protein KQI52_12285 [bacterium]|nr:hypothetical protein [bacterium]
MNDANEAIQGSSEKKTVKQLFLEKAQPVAHEQIEALFVAYENFRQHNDYTEEIINILDSDTITALFSRFGSAFCAFDMSEIINKLRDNDIRPIDIVIFIQNYGLLYRFTYRYNESNVIFMGLYEYMQLHPDFHRHKGAPLVWLRDNYWDLGYKDVAMKFMMLTLVEDAIQDSGELKTTNRGVYFRIVWSHNLPAELVRDYFSEVYKIYTENGTPSFPEDILLELDYRWKNTIPTHSEMKNYSISKAYAKVMLEKAKIDKTGRLLEKLMKYLLLNVPGCKSITSAIVGSGSDHDVLATFDGPEVDFRSDTGRLLICQCKNTKDRTGIKDVNHFAYYLQSSRVSLGLLVSINGITGEDGTKIEEEYALRIITHLAQRTNTYIILIDEDDLEKIAQGLSILIIINEKYLKIRLDLAKDPGML